MAGPLLLGHIPPEACDVDLSCLGLPGLRKAEADDGFGEPGIAWPLVYLAGACVQRTQPL